MSPTETMEALTHYLSLGTFVGAVVAAGALFAKLSQDRKDLRRKQAEVARLVYNDLHQDEYSMAALIMLDFREWRHTTKDFSKIEVSYEDVKTALTVMHQDNRPDTELLVRRAIDSLFSKLENVIALAHKDIGLIRWSDFAALFGYYVHLMRKRELRGNAQRLRERVWLDQDRRAHRASRPLSNSDLSRAYEGFRRYSE